MERKEANKDDGVLTGRVRDSGKHVEERTPEKGSSHKALPRNRGFPLRFSVNE